MKSKNFRDGPQWSCCPVTECMDLKHQSLMCAFCNSLAFWQHHACPQAMSLPFHDAIDGFICLSALFHVVCFGTWLVTVHFVWVQYSFNQWHFELKNPHQDFYHIFVLSCQPLYHSENFPLCFISYHIIIIISHFNHLSAPSFISSLSLILTPLPPVFWTPYRIGFFGKL